MKLFDFLLIAAIAALPGHFASSRALAQETLPPDESVTVLYQWDFVKFKRDIYLEGDGTWEDPLLKAFASDEQNHVEMLDQLINHYDIEKPEVYWGNYSMLLWENEEMKPLLMSDRDWLATREEFFTRAAYVEEMHIRDLTLASAETGEQLLKDSYSEMLSQSCTHLASAAERLHENPFEYGAQLLDQEQVDECLVASAPQPEFTINAGLNDAWYDPAVPGQGFFITVYEDLGTVFLTWNTYDIMLPDEDIAHSLGDPGQRWLTAHGKFEGKEAELKVYSCSGGLFNEHPPAPEMEWIGEMFLTFESCTSGSVRFNLAPIFAGDTIPIRRVAPDNVADCKVRAYLD